MEDDVGYTWYYNKIQQKNIYIYNPISSAVINLKLYNYNI